ncbi:MAG TPA: precorrin-4 C(11)-methyltransferase, partial [Rubrobacter sp.]|nr:precorrin-4 C(11)-methyltransferase [Rubrobacter sp.]
LQDDLLDGGYAPETPCAVVYRASWPDEEIIECRLEELADRIRAAGFTRQALILVGPGLGAGGTRSHLYSPAFSHMFRKASQEA